MKQNRVMVTGANGLLGEVLTRRLLENDYEVFGLVREKTDFVDLKNYHEIELNLLSEFNYEKLPNEIDTVVHLAQSPEFKNFPNSANNIFTVNTLSTLKLLDYAKQTDVKKFIYASSGAVYESSHELITEHSKLIEIGNSNFYAVTKLASEYLIGTYKNLINTTILRFFFIYGPGQDSQMLFPALATRIRDGAPITLNGPEGIRINPIHVIDAAKRVHEFIESEKPGTFNISGHQSVTIKEICDLMASELKLKPKYEVTEMTRNFETKIELGTVIDQDAEFDLIEGIRDMLNGGAR